MLQLKVLSGTMAGTDTVARRFPFTVGRAGICDLVLQEPGVFDQHLKIDLNGSREFVASSVGETFIAVSGQQNLKQAILKNSDIIEVGQAKLLCALSPAKQRSLVPREVGTWIGLGLVTAFQIFLVCWLLK